VVCVAAAAIALAAFMIYSQGWQDGYLLGRCETKCGSPPRDMQREARYPPSALLICTCGNGDVFRLVE
jgi:hypothetical protein